MRLSTLFVLIFWTGKVLAQMPVWHGQLLLHDGQSIMPNASIPTPAEVAAISQSAATAKSQAQTLSSTAAALRADAQRLDVQAAALDGSMIVYGTCVAFGAEAVEVPTNISATVVDFNFPSNGTSYVQLFISYSEPMAEVWPMSATSLSAEWMRAEPVESLFGTWNIGGQAVDAFRMLVPTDNAEMLFFRGSGEARQSVVGQLNVLGGLTVNGREGLTVTNSIGVFHQGLLVEPMPVMVGGEGGEEQ